MEPAGKIALILQTLSWRALVDVFILAVGLFFLYRTFVRLGTWKIAMGVGMALLVYLVAVLLDLTGVEWVFGNVSHVAVIALIVIFQPELRKVFEQTVSMKRVEVGGKGEELAGIVEEAAAVLAKQKRGAIIVFPGKEPVREWLSGGVRLDAEPSLSLLLSIFDPHSPGHDGAVIVWNGRLAGYGVRLPVSDTSRLPQEYGTRHHAAMGLSEKTDALVLVVSEERGRVSLFSKGEYKALNNDAQGGGRLNGEEKIADAIVRHWDETATHALELPTGKNRHNVAVRMLASLSLAVLFWAALVFTSAEVLEKVVTVPVEYAASPPDLMMVGEKRQEVGLHLAGPKSALDSLSPSQLAVRIDLSKAAEGEQTFLLTGENIRLPRGVSLLDVSPESLTVTLAEIVAQDLTVTPQFVGKPPAGFVVSSVRVAPSHVRAMLPADTDKSRKVTLTTTPIYLEGMSGTTRLFCKIIAPPSVQPVDRRWPDVEVVIEILPEKDPEPGNGG